MAVSATPEALALAYAQRQVRALGYRLREVEAIRPLKTDTAHRRPEPVLPRLKRRETGR